MAKRGQSSKNAKSGDARERRRKNREINRQLHPWTKRRIAAWTMFVLAFVIAVNHIFAHLGDKVVPLGMGTQDLVIGWPMAALIALAGLMIIDPREPKTTKNAKSRRH